MGWSAAVSFPCSSRTVRSLLERLSHSWSRSDSIHAYPSAATGQTQGRRRQRRLRRRPQARASGYQACIMRRPCWSRRTHTCICLRRPTAFNLIVACVRVGAGWLVLGTPTGRSGLLCRSGLGPSRFREPCIRRVDRRHKGPLSRHVHFVPNADGVGRRRPLHVVWYRAELGLRVA